MSAYVYLTSPDKQSGHMFADGAGYTDDGIVRWFGPKIICGEVAPFAITAIGNHELGEKLKAFMVRQADRLGVDDFFDIFLPEFLSELAMSYADAQHSADKHLAVVISAWSKTKGAFRLSFQTVTEPGRDDIQPFVAQITTDMAFRGPEFSPLRLMELRQPSPGEKPSDFMAYAGRAIMGFMRDVPAVQMRLRGTGAPPHYLVGGHIDMATVDEKGARIERIHVWDDKIGERIRPESAAATVVPFGGNRKARRAAKRKAA